MATQYTFSAEAEAIAAKRRWERLGYRVFTPYWSGSGQTWNIIIA